MSAKTSSPCPPHTHQLRQVITPGQEEQARVVLLPVRHEETHEHAPHAEEHAERRDAELELPKHGEQRDGDEEGGPRVQPVVKQLPQRTAHAQTAGLLPVYTVCGTGRDNNSTQQCYLHQ